MTPAIGLWASFCCCQDAFQIATQDDLEDVRDNPDKYAVYATLADLVDAECSCGVGDCTRLQEDAQR